MSRYALAEPPVLAQYPEQITVLHLRLDEVDVLLVDVADQRGKDILSATGWITVKVTPL